jgi:hypothetical protein
MPGPSRPSVATTTEFHIAYRPLPAFLTLSGISCRTPPPGPGGGEVRVSDFWVSAALCPLVSGVHWRLASGVGVGLAIGNW